MFISVTDNVKFLLQFVLTVVNPMGQVPAIVDGRFQLFERYLKNVSIGFLSYDFLTLFANTVDVKCVLL